jgi:CheY-like chemotaxis protein
VAEPQTTLDQIDAYFQKQAARAAEKKAGTHTPRVLLIDDDENFCLMVQHTFAAKGVSIHTALSGYEGHDKARLAPDPYDLVLLDLKLPGLSGPEVFRRLKRDCPTAPVVICSGHAKDEDMDEILRIGGYFGFLEKPFDVEKLAEVFRHYRLPVKD